MKLPKLAGLLTMIAGAIMIIAGGFTYYTVSSQLASQNITVSGDASCQAGQKVNGPVEAYCQAQIIDKHALKATGGKTYSELDREDPKRPTAMNGALLQSALYTSVVSFGVAAMAMGLGAILVLVGAALRALAPTTAVRNEELATA